MEREITVMIVDDEQEAIDYLSLLVKESFPELNIVATARSSDEAIQLAFRKHPDLIFLDVKIDSKNGFDILQELVNENHHPYVIFVSAHSKYALDAFKTNATDYLLKPVDIEDLQQAVNKFVSQSEKEKRIQSLGNLLNMGRNKIRFNTRNGYILINPDEIVYCQSDGNYSDIVLKDETKSVVCYNLKNLYKELPAENFRRISRYIIINLECLTEVDKGRQNCVLTNQGKRIVLGYSPRMMGGLL